MAQRRTLDNLIALMIPEIQKIFVEAMQDIADQAILNEVIEAIERNDPEAAFKAIGFTPAALTPILKAIDRAFEEAGTITGEGFPSRIRTPTGTVIFRFDIRNTRAEQTLRTHSSAFVTRLTEEARENVRVGLERGMIAGKNPRATALDIVGRIDPVTKNRVGGVIGLTNNQERWVANARRDLEQLDKRYLTRELRDKRFDSVVLKAIEGGKPLPASTIDKLIIAYKSRALKYRGEVIAQTETIQGINRGEWQAHMQLVDDGTVKRSAIVKEWDSAGDSHVRSTHRSMDTTYHKKGIDIEAPFVSPSGARLMFPGDSSFGAPADEIIGCRCRQKIKVDWLADLGDE